MKITRRNLALALAGAGAAKAQRPAPANDDLRMARERLRAASQILARRELPMSAEPALQFKA